jgi:hypothetical protein
MKYSISQSKGQGINRLGYGNTQVSERFLAPPIHLREEAAAMTISPMAFIQATRADKGGGSSYADSGSRSGKKSGQGL